MIDMATGHQQLPHYPIGPIAVMGAGAVGCYYGFKLARAGHDVVLIGRPQLVGSRRSMGRGVEVAGGQIDKAGLPQLGESGF